DGTSRVAENGVVPNGGGGSRLHDHALLRIERNQVARTGKYAADGCVGSANHLHAGTLISQRHSSRAVRANVVARDHLAAGAIAADQYAARQVCRNDVAVGSSRAT